jgi:hypothetical protein
MLGAAEHRADPLENVLGTRGARQVEARSLDRPLREVHMLVPEPGG